MASDNWKKLALTCYTLNKGKKMSFLIDLIIILLVLLSLRQLLGVIVASEMSEYNKVLIGSLVGALLFSVLIILEKF